MQLDWHSLDRWMMGEAWTGTCIETHLNKLCREIGPRWSSSEAEWAAIHYLREQIEAEFHHERGDTADKVHVPQLKEYVGQLARLLLRLSHVPPEDWPQNPWTAERVQARLQEERGSVVRVF